jgi:AcrR family transcriptional regulator
VPDEESDDLGPLPAGRHGFSREQVAHHQRERLIAALAEIVVERGYNEVTVSDIAAKAKVSKRTFYEHFDSKESCFLVAFDIVIDHLHDLIDAAIQPLGDWPSQTVEALRTVLRFFASEPNLARLCMVESLTAGPKVAERYREAILGFAPLLKPGRQEHKGAESLPDSIEDTVIGSLATVITREIAAGRTGELEQLLPDFTAFVLMPYLGQDEARRLARKVVA